MNMRVLVVETSPAVFDDWTNVDYGLAARLDAKGMDPNTVTVERLTSSGDLEELAADIKNSAHLPARALLLQGIEHSDLGTDVSELATKGLGFISDNHEKVGSSKPEDYDETTDAPWPIAGDWEGLLYPYTRLIARRLVQKAVPDVDFTPTEEARRDWSTRKRRSYLYSDHPKMSRIPVPNTTSELFEGGDNLDKRGLRPEYGGWLARVNRHLSATGQDFMAIIDGRGHGIYDRWTRMHGGAQSRDRNNPRNRTIRGADINIVHPDISNAESLMREPGTAEVVNRLMDRNPSSWFKRGTSAKEAYATWLQLANEPSELHWLNYRQGPRMWLVANLLEGRYPYLSDKDQVLDVPTLNIDALAK